MAPLEPHEPHESHEHFDTLSAACDERHMALDERMGKDEKQVNAKFAWFWKILGSLVIAAMIALGFSITYAMTAHDKIQAALILQARTQTMVERQSQDTQEIKEILREIEKALRK